MKNIKNQVIINVLRLGFDVFARDLDPNEEREFMEAVKRFYSQLDSTNSGEY